MYTQAEFIMVSRTTHVRSIVTFKDREHRFLTPIEVLNGNGNWEPINEDAEDFYRQAEDALIAAFNPEAEAAGDWRCP
jgi:hypothetical protein